MKDYKLVTDKESLKLLYDDLKSSKVVAVDTESTGLNIRKDRVIGASFSTEEDEGFYLPTMHYNHESKSFDTFYIEGKENAFWLKSIFLFLVENDKKLIMHNGAYDTGIILNNFGIDLLPLLWIETTLIVHTVEEEGAWGFGDAFALKSIAIKWQEELGMDVETAANEEQILLKKNVAKNGGKTTKKQFEIYKADLEVLYPYAIADTDLTLRVAKLFLGKLVSEGLNGFFFEEEVMPVYKEVTVPMERRGIKLDVSLIEKRRDEIEEDIIKYRKDIIEILIESEKVQEWVANKAYYDKFPPKNKGSFAKKLVEIFKIPIPYNDKGPHLIKKNIEALPDSSFKKFLIDKDSDHGIDVADLLRVSVSLWEDFNNGYVNIGSKQQMSEIVFDYFGEKPISYTPKGAPQFNDTVITKLSKKYSWAEKLSIFNKLGKIKSTYMDRFLEKEEDGIFYPYFKQHGTVSGRYGSDLQQLPKPKEEDEDAEIVVKYNNLVRAFFIAREGYSFIDSDYESLEPNCFASISNDKNLQEIFNKGYDFYSTVAIRTENIKGVSADKKADNYLKKIYPTKRADAKSYCLGIPYGMSGYALAKSLGVPVKRGEELREAYLRGFPGVARWMKDSIRQFKENGFVINDVGRIRHLRRGKEAYDRFGDSIGNWEFRAQLAHQIGGTEVKRLYMDYKNAIHSATNSQIQSLAASIVNRSALKINREFKKRGWDGLTIAQIHDQLVIEIKEEYAEEAAKIVQNIMENIIKLRGVTLKAPPEIAKNFLEGH